MESEKLIKLNVFIWHTLSKHVKTHQIETQYYGDQYNLLISES